MTEVQVLAGSMCLWRGIRVEISFWQNHRVIQVVSGGKGAADDGHSK